MKTEYLDQIIHLALAEDIGRGDVTTQTLVPRHSQSQAQLIAKSAGVVCGLNVAFKVFKVLDPHMQFKTLVKDGDKVKKGQVLAHLKGATRSLLSGERVALNLLSALSGIATKTRGFVDQIYPYKTAIMDTRKTTPLLREMERYAVRCGGGVNHRFNLSDMAMVKDNHRLSCQRESLTETVNALKKKIKVKLEVEVDNLSEFKQVLASKADIILLDNMKPAMIAKAVALRNKNKSHVLLEASGGITLKNVRQYAATKVDRVSIGALTHSREALDISLDFIQ